jgi:hypothetical protein
VHDGQLERNAHLRVGATAAAVFVALLLAGVARGDGPGEPAVPANATPAPERDGPRLRDRYDDRRRGGGEALPDFGEGAPGGGAVPAPGSGVPDLGQGAPGDGGAMPDFGGGAGPGSGGNVPSPDSGGAPGGAVPMPGPDTAPVPDAGGDATTGTTT